MTVKTELSDFRCKYFSRGNLENLLHCQMRFTQSSFFNDEFEFFGDADSDKEIYNNILETTSNTLRDCYFDSESKLAACAAIHIFKLNDFFGIPETVHVDQILHKFGFDLILELIAIKGRFECSTMEALKKIIEVVSPSVNEVVRRYVDSCIGVLCMTDSHENDTAWKTYAGESSGFCVVVGNNFLRDNHVEGSIQYLDDGEVPGKISVTIKTGLGQEYEYDNFFSKDGVPLEFLKRFYIKNKFGYDQFYDKEKQNLLNWSNEHERRYLGDIRTFDYLTGKCLERNPFRHFYKSTEIKKTAFGMQPISKIDFDQDNVRYIILGENHSKFDLVSLFSSTISNVGTFNYATPAVRVMVEGGIKYVCGAGRAMPECDYPSFRISGHENGQSHYIATNTDKITIDKMKDIFTMFYIAGSIFNKNHRKIMNNVMKAMSMKMATARDHLNGIRDLTEEQVIILSEIDDISFRGIPFENEELYNLGVRKAELNDDVFSAVCDLRLKFMQGARFEDLDILTVFRNMFYLTDQDNIIEIYTPSQSLSVGYTNLAEESYDF